MNITNAQYTATGSITALVDGVEMSIPANSGNRHYREMVEKGIAIAPYVKPSHDQALTEWRSTATLSRAQFCMRAFRAGLLPKADAIAAAKGEWPPSFDAAIAGLPENIKIEAQIEWAAVNEIRRDADTLVFVQVAEQIDDAQIDALFGWKET